MVTHEIITQQYNGMALYHNGPYGDVNGPYGDVIVLLG